MKATVQHATLGEIVYTEGAWSGKKTLTVGGGALVCSLLLMQMQKKPLYKVLIGIAFLAAAILVCYLIALALLAGAGSK